MSKVFILPEKELKAYDYWKELKRKARKYAKLSIDGEQAFMERWLAKHPCPLPAPVEIPTEEEINAMYPITKLERVMVDTATNKDNSGARKGYRQCLSDLLIYNYL